MLKIWKTAADFQNVYRYNVCLCSSVVLADVLEHNCNPAGENELSSVVGFILAWFGIPACFHLSYIVGKKMCTLIAGFPDEMWMLQQPKEELVAFFSKTKKFSKSSSTTRSSAAMFLVDMICTQIPAQWHPKIPIKWYESIYFVSLVEKKAQFPLSRKRLPKIPFKW